VALIFDVIGAASPHSLCCATFSADGTPWRRWPLEQQGKFAEALAEFDAALTQSGGLSIAMASRAHALALSGQKSEAERVAHESH
jgi:hypothetical protein